MKCYGEEVYRSVQGALCVNKRLRQMVICLYIAKQTDLWNMFLCILGVNWTMPRTTFEVLIHWQEIGRRGSKEDWWKYIPACIWWTLWRERNERCFEGNASNIQKIKSRCLSLLYFWCKQDIVGEPASLVEFIRQL